MKSTLYMVLAAVFLIPVQATGGEFSLFKVKMGMPRQEIDLIWSRLDSGEYSIPDSTLFNIMTEFDHNDRLLRLNFSAPIGEQYPSNLMATAYQRLVKDMWGDDPMVSVSTRSSKGVVETTVSSRKLTEEYIEHIKVQLSTLLRP